MEESSSPSRSIIIPQGWSDAADSISGASTTPISFICGAKNSGKSTFSRYLLNILLTRYKKVVYLDADVGQPEFTTPGCLSLHVIGEQIPDLAILTMKTPERCIFFGDTSSKRDPKTYLNSIFSLYDYYQTEYYQSNEIETSGNIQFPLVINTPGWVKGIGYDIVVEMLRYFEPTHVVQIRISVEKKNLPCGNFWMDGNQKMPVNMINLSAARQDSSNRSLLVKKDNRGLRDARIVAYFRQCFPSDSIITTNKDLALALASHPPYRVPLSKIKVMHLHCQVQSSELFHSLNATIVGLAVSSRNPEESKTSMPRCLGLGLVRGVDISRELLYVITPVPQSHLKKINILLQGFIQIPTFLLLVDGCASPYMSTHVLPVQTRETEQECEA